MAWNWGLYDRESELAASERAIAGASNRKVVN